MKLPYLAFDIHRNDYVEIPIAIGMTEKKQ